MHLLSASMLRIISRGETDGQKWILCGQLAGPWVAELRNQWMLGREESPRLPPLVDLSDVTFIDEAGEELLRTMHGQGATFVSRGVDTSYLLQNLTQSDGSELRRFLGQCGDRGCS